MMNSLFNNWPWKLLSLIFAIILWFMIINYQDPVSTKSIENIKVELINEDSITSKNQAVEYIEGKVVDIKIEGKRSALNKLKKSDINIKADLNKVSITGAVDLEIDLPVGLDLVSKSPSMMMINMEKIKSKLKTASPFYEGELAKGYIHLVPTITPNQVEITGTESKLAQISSVIVPINIDDVKDDITLYVKPQFLDNSGNEIEGLSSNTATVEVKLPVQKLEEKQIILVPYGEISEDYRVAYIRPSVSKTLVHGYESNLNTLSNISINDIDLSSLKDTDSKIIKKLADYLPEGINLLNEEDFYIELKIDKLVEKEIILSKENIKFIYPEENLNYDIDTYFMDSIKLKGTKEELEKIDEKTLNATIDLRNRKELGEYLTPVDIVLPDEVDVLDVEDPKSRQITVKINVSVKADTSSENEE